MIQIQTPIIELENVSKIYKMGDTNLIALDNISLKINKGDFIAIIGPSGSGKSTLMNLVGCLDIPNSGIVKLDNQDITKLSESKLAKLRGQKIGFIFQQFNLLPIFSALSNVMLPLEFQDLSDSQIKSRSLEALRLVNLEDRMNHYPNQLSGGQRQRVAIARALVVDPDIILADEPTGNLDSKTGIFIIDFLKKLHKEQNKTIIMVTHDLNLAKNAEKIIHIIDGKINKIELNKKDN
ncbi:MAG: ABC transporter ATP-binding protein [archaeon]